MRVSFKSRFFLLLPPSQISSPFQIAFYFQRLSRYTDRSYRRHPITDSLITHTSITDISHYKTLGTTLKGQRVRFHSNRGGAIYGYAFIETRKGTLVIVTFRSFWKFRESSKGLYQCDISTVVSDYSKDCSF